MALIACDECGREISDRAATCPHCGAPVVPPAKIPPYSPPASIQEPGFLKKPRGCGTLIIAVIVMIVLVRACSPEPRKAAPAPIPEPAVATPAERAAELARALAGMDDEAASASSRLARAKWITIEHPGTPDAERAAALVPVLEEALREEQIGRQWRYTRSEDSMSGQVSHTAIVTSTNQFEFGFPYAGPQRGELTIRRHPRWGNSVIFAIERGQILCNSYSSCPIRVRFDDGAPRTLSGNEPADNSSEYVFLPGYNDFVSRLQKAKRLRIEVNVFQQGAVMAEFDVEGFKPERLKD